MDMVNGTTEFSKWFFRERIEGIESEREAIRVPMARKSKKRRAIGELNVVPF